MPPPPRPTEDGRLTEAVEEQISLSERFGRWISFYSFSQQEYLTIVAQWLRHFGLSEAQIEAARQPALVWALERGSRSGRVAYQFARDLAGRGGTDDTGLPVASPASGGGAAPAGHSAAASATDDDAPQGLDHV